MKKSILLGVVASIAVLGLVAAVVIYHFGFRQRFVIESTATIKVFYDAGLTNELHQGDTLNWGPITTTDAQHKTLWIENVGTVDATLQLGYDQNQPPWKDQNGNPTGWSLTWDAEGATVVHGGAPIQANLTLTLPSTIDAGTWDIGSEIRATPVS
jgi:type II secretory pathway pseudopilin PulG